MAADAVRAETWDLTESHSVEQVKWGANGWNVSEAYSHQSLVDGPLDLTILLPGARKIQGTFVMAIVARDDGEVEDVSLVMEGTSRETAYQRARTFLEQLEVSGEYLKKLEKWWLEEPEKWGKEEGVLINELRSSNPGSLGVEILHVWGPTPDSRWVVEVGFSWPTVEELLAPP